MAWVATVQDPSIYRESELISGQEKLDRNGLFIRKIKKGKSVLQRFLLLQNQVMKPLSHFVHSIVIFNILL